MSDSQSPYAPPAVQVHAPPNAIGVPYRNEPAHMAFYLGLLSIIPCFPIGIVALALGIIGLEKRKENPALKGSFHAWVGILVGGFFGLIWLLSIVLMVFFGTSLRSVAASLF